MSIPRKGSRLMNWDGEQFRWIAKGKRGFTEIRLQIAEIPEASMVIGRAPRVFQERMVEELVERALSVGWDPVDFGEGLNFKFSKGRWLLVEDFDE